MEKIIKDENTIKTMKELVSYFTQDQTIIHQEPLEFVEYKPQYSFKLKFDDCKEPHYLLKKYWNRSNDKLVVSDLKFDNKMNFEGYFYRPTNNWLRNHGKPPRRKIKHKLSNSYIERKMLEKKISKELNVGKFTFKLNKNGTMNFVMRSKDEI